MNRPRFPERVILSHAKTTLDAAQKNLAALRRFGITEAFLNKFEANILTGESLRRDMDNQLELKELTMRKDDALAACVQWGRELRLRMELAYGKKSAEFKSFPALQFKKAAKNKSRMISLMELLLQLAQKHHEKLAERGLTAGVIQNGVMLRKNLIAAASSQELKKSQRCVDNQKRYAHFQQLYETVNIINKVGRLAFADDAAHLTLFESPWPKRASLKKNLKKTFEIIT